MNQAEVLNEKIESSGLKKVYIAQKLGISQQLFNMMLKGKATMSEDIRLKATKLVNSVIEAQV